MVRKSGRDKTRKPSPATQDDKAQSAVERWSWLLSFLLMISAADGGPFQMVRVLPAPADSVLTHESAWQPPLLSLGVSQIISECPYWLFAVVISFLLSWLVRSCFRDQRAQRNESGFEFLILAALSLPVSLVDLSTASLFIGAATLLVQPYPAINSRLAWLKFLVTTIAAVIICVDFSFVLLVLLVGWLKHSRQFVPGRQIAYVVTGFTSLLIGGAIFIPGFAAALGRPLTWSAVAENHLSMSLVSVDDSTTWVAFGLTLFVVVHSWCLAWKTTRRTPELLLPLAFFSVLSLTCRYYQWLSLLGIVSCSDYSVSVRRIVLSDRLLRWSLFLIVLLSLAPRFDSYCSFVMTGHWPRQYVDPAEWGTSGRVMLMHPDNSSRWQTAASRKSFQLLVDDRWDIFGDEYRNYRLVCRDLSEFRSSRFLRSDGTWGGYKQWTEKWKPTLLVVDSSDLDGIRRLSMSPDWNVVGIDSHRTILAAQGEPENASQLRIAARLLSELEWPSTQFDGSYGNVIAANGSSAQEKVARVLLAMRLPYAALRVMPQTDNPTDDLSALCYFERSHRVFRHTQANSLLDQYRAVYHLRKLAAGNELSAKQLIRVARGLETLGESETAIEFATQLFDQSKSTDFREQKWATELIARCKIQRDKKTLRFKHQQDASIRHGFLSGNQTAVSRYLDRLSGREHDFFNILAESIHNTPEDIYFELIDQLNDADFPEHLRGEALFYLGSLAIEAGDSQSAVNAFSASIQAAPNQPLNSISRVSLMNLQKGSR